MQHPRVDRAGPSTRSFCIAPTSQRDRADRMFVFYDGVITVSVSSDGRFLSCGLDGDLERDAPLLVDGASDHDPKRTVVTEDGHVLILSDGLGCVVGVQIIKDRRAKRL